MNNLNMRRVLKQPTLRMSTGGGLPRPEEGQAIGAGNSIPTEGLRTYTEADGVAAAAAHKVNMDGFARQSAYFAPPAADPVAAPTTSLAQSNAAKSFIGEGIGGRQLAVPGITQSGPIMAQDGLELHAQEGFLSSVRGLLRPAPAASAPVDRIAANKARLQAEGGTWGNVGGATTPQAPATPSALRGDGVSSQTKAALRAIEVADNPMLKKHGGDDLQTGQGGNVPGHGRGDKVPAKYEPGEFVVSNAMLDAKPSLRGELRALRKRVLAKKGMTPQMADAQAMGGGVLRAQEGKTSAYTLPQWGPNVIHPDDLDLRNVAPGSQPMPAASIQYEQANQARTGNKLNALNQPGVDSRNAQLLQRDAWNKPSPQGPIGSPAADRFAQEVMSAKARTARAALRNAPQVPAPAIALPNQARTPFEVDGKMLAAATKPGAPLAPPKVAAPAPGAPGYLDPSLTVPKEAPKGTVANLRAAPGAAMGAIKNIRLPGGFNLGSPAQVAAQKLATRGLGAAALAPDVIKGLQVANAPGHTNVDAFAQGSETVGKFASAVAGAGVGAKSGAAVGALFGGVGAIPGAAIGSVLGGGAGYMFGDGAIKSLRGAYDHYANDTPWSEADTRSPHDKLVAAPATTQAPIQASYSNEGRNHATPYVAPAVPKTVQGPNGQMYLDGAVSNEDHARSQAQIRQAFGRPEKTGGDFSMDAGISRLRGDAASMAKANEGWATRGAGIRASLDEKGGLVLSNSTAPEKMQYTAPDGKPTTDYTKTQQYAEGMQERNKLLAAGAAADQRMQANAAAEADARERAAIPGLGMFGHNNAQRSYETKAALRQTAEHNRAQIGVQQDHNKVLREGHDVSRENNAALREQAMIPFRIAQANRDAITRVQQAVKAGGGNEEDVHRILMENGMPEAAKSYGEALTQTEDRRSKQSANMTKQFDGMFIDPATGAPDKNAEALAAQTHAKLLKGEIANAGDSHDLKQQAILHTKALLSMQRKAKLRDDGMWNSMFGADGKPTALDPSSRAKVSSLWTGATTGHKFGAGDINYGDHELESDVGGDVVEYLNQYNDAYRAKTKPKAK